MAEVVLLLRGINVGRHRRIKMSDLKALLEGSGFEEVRTQGQSGNVVALTGSRPAAAGTAAERALEDELGHGVQVVVRSAAAFRRVLEDDPFAGVRSEGKLHHVVFCSAKPAAAVIRALRESAAEGERVEALGAEIHAWIPGGLMDSGLMERVDKLKPAPVVTVRNWNTVEKVAALLSA